MLVLGLAAVLWGLGWAIGTPARLRVQMVVLLWGAAVAAHLVLPDGHPLRIAVGGSAAGWLVLGAVALLVLGYVVILNTLKSRAKPPQGSVAPNDVELNRYARHILLREIGGSGQMRLRAAKVLVVGAGGLGSPVILYLAAAGVGTIGVIDGDVVDPSNLQRQIIHSDDRIGLPKVQSALVAAKALNPFITLRPYHRRLTEDIARDLIADYDLVLDGTDNFDTRYLVNRICANLGKPLISGAMTQWEGQVSLYHPAAGAPCYQCVFPERPAPGMVPTCAEAGVVAPLPGIIGSIMAVEAIKHLTSAGETLAGRLMIHDALYAESRVIGAKRRPDCPVCGADHPHA
jgi:molybdopterin/thiamine biosynthesis adenylyltransferase